jgi:hypothetical protein
MAAEIVYNKAPARINSKDKYQTENVNVSFSGGQVRSGECDNVSTFCMLSDLDIDGIIAF